MTRSEQREQAFYLIFENEFQPSDNLIEIYDDNLEKLSDFAKELFNGVVENKDSIDEVISKFSKGWKLERLPKVTLSVLRLAVYEMNYIDNVPSSVSINEAVELAKKFGTKEDASFINGILGSFDRSKN